MNSLRRTSLAAMIAMMSTGIVLCSGCSTNAEEVSAGDEQDIVPESAKTLFDQVGVCDKTLDRHKGIKEVDLKDGLLRWACGDVPGVTGKDLGQEYCEYHAVQNGKPVVTAGDLAQDKKLSCVFSSVYSDVKETANATRQYASKLAGHLASTENLGVETDPKVAVMARGFNSRGAATALISDCANDATSAPKDEERQVACFEAAMKNPSNAAELTRICRSKTSLDDEAEWAKVVALGAKVAQPGDENHAWQRDRAACLRTRAAKGLDWRNSDPMICARVSRAAAECKTSYNPVPEALDGFVFTGWVNRALPAGCRKAKVEGKDYDQLVICDASDSEVEDIATNPAWAGDVSMFCRERFGNDLVMMAPIRALEATKPTHEGAYCSLYAPTSEESK